MGDGNYVVIDHGGGFVTLHGHLDRAVVATGSWSRQELGLLSHAVQP